MIYKKVGNLSFKFREEKSNVIKKGRKLIY